MSSTTIENSAEPMSLLTPVKLLAEGAKDMRSTGFTGIAYGIIFVMMGYAITGVYQHIWQMTMGLTAAFFLMGPFICCGVYDLSRQQEVDGHASLWASMTCWARNWKSIAFLPRS